MADELERRGRAQGNWKELTPDCVGQGKYAEATFAHAWWDHLEPVTRAMPLPPGRETDDGGFDFVSLSGLRIDVKATTYGPEARLFAQRKPMPAGFAADIYVLAQILVDSPGDPEARIYSGVRWYGWATQDDLFAKAERTTELPNGGLKFEVASRRLRRMPVLVELLRGERSLQVDDDWTL